MSELISIIVPVYNVEKYVSNCLDSLIKQTYFNIEIIIIDDGSTDNSGTICDMYALNDKRIKVIHTKNRGLSAARNEGLHNSNGDYIGFIDSDDWLSENTIEILYNLLVNNNSDFSVCGIIDEYIKPTEKIKNNNNSYHIVNKKDIYKKIIDDKNFYGYVWNKLFKRNIIESENLIFDEKLLSCEDIDFLVKYVVKSNVAVYTTEKLYHYRHHSNSMTGDFTYNERKLSILDAYEHIIPIYKEYCEEYINKIYSNYLKIAINIKGRMKLSKVNDTKTSLRLNRIIQTYYPIVLKDKNNSLLLKGNIYLSSKFPGEILKLKQKILNRKFRQN